jgi:predicted ATP-binding protein involved in virulence
MFLKSIKFKNFRCFSNHELSFVNDDSGQKKENIRRATVLLGDNGTGKSNLLKGIGLVTAGRDALAELLDEPESWIQVGKKFCQLDAVLKTAAGEERRVFLRIEAKDSVSRVLDRAKESLAELDEALEHTNRNYFVLAYGASRQLNVNRGRRARSSAYSHARALSVATLFNPDEVLTPIESWAMDLDYLKSRGAMSVIRKVMSEFLRGVEFSRIDKEGGQLIFKTPFGTVPMSQLSDGYQNVAAWIGDLLYRVTEIFGDYSAPLKTRGLLLIDEVDLHLHPRWQRDLLEFLRRKLPNFQIVATTHSPITAQQADENELHYLERRGRSLKLHPFSGVPKALLLHQLVMSDVFGLTSDESAALEKKKARYEKLCYAEKHTAAQKKEMERLEKELSVAPQAVRSNVPMSQDHLDLMKSIQKELEGRRS